MSLCAIAMHIHVAIVTHAWWSTQSPLMAATKIGSLDCVKLLLYHGANLYYKYSNVLMPSVRVWNVARRMNHTVLEQYLKNCDRKCSQPLSFFLE